MAFPAWGDSSQSARKPVGRDARHIHTDAHMSVRVSNTLQPHFPDMKILRWLLTVSSHFVTCLRPLQLFCQSRSVAGWEHCGKNEHSKIVSTLMWGWRGVSTHFWNAPLIHCHSFPHLKNDHIGRLWKQPITTDTDRRTTSSGPGNYLGGKERSRAKWY